MISATAAWLSVPCAAYFGWCARELYDSVRSYRRTRAERRNQTEDQLR